MHEIELLGEVHTKAEKPKRSRPSRSPLFQAYAKLNERITHWCKTCKYWHGKTCLWKKFHPMK